MFRGLSAGFYLFLASAPALAQSALVTLEDPSYLPGEGQLLSDTDLSYERLYQGRDFLSYSRESYLVSHEFQYGLTEDLAVGLGEECAYRNETLRYNYGGGYGGEFDYKDFHGGCGDPVIKAVYRVWRQEGASSFPVTADLSATFSPNLAKAQYDSDNTAQYATVSTAQGGASGDINLAFSHIFEEASLLGRVGVTLTGRSMAADSRGDYIEYTAYARPYVEMLAQYRPDRDIALTLGIKAYGGYRTSETEYAAPYPYFPYSLYNLTSNKMGTELAPSLSASIALIPDRLDASILYRHSFIGDANLDYGPSGFPGYTSSVRDISADSITFSLRVLWF